MNAEIIGEHYQIQQQLGKQTGRRTLLVRDMRNQELAVIKLLLFGSNFQWQDLKLFQREATVLESLSHPAIPRYLDSFDLDLPKRKGFALVQTYIDAKSLEEQVKAGRRFTEDEVKQLAKSLLEILIYLHNREPPVIHRDIKPSNILLTNRSGNSVGDVYLVDFGSVQNLAAQEGGTITVVGTYGYMPPEQFGGRTVAASDLYSLGATLIYLITGTHPANLPQKDGRIEFEESANISFDFRDWLKRMVQPYQDKRFASASQALQVLEQPVADACCPGVRKPAGSKIKLTKDRDSLTIDFPITNDSWMAALLCGGVAIFITLRAVVLFAFQNGGFLILFGFLFIVISIDVLTIFIMFRDNYLCINKQQITFMTKLLNFKWNHHETMPAKRQDINKLVYIPRQVTRNYNENNSKIIPHNSEILPHLIIFAGKQQYIIDSSKGVDSEPEIEWLAHELSDWLGLPITEERK